MDGHIIYLRLPPAACLSAEQHRGCVTIECPAAELNELCKWLRLTADSLDGKLSASELGHLRAVDVCQRYAKEHPGEALTATKIAVEITKAAVSP